MKLRLKDYQISSSYHGYVVNKVVKIQDPNSKNYGEDNLTDPAFIPNEEQLSRYLLKCELDNCENNSLDGLIAEFKDKANEITQLLKQNLSDKD